MKFWQTSLYSIFEYLFFSSSFIAFKIIISFSTAKNFSNNFLNMFLLSFNDIKEKYLILSSIEYCFDDEIISFDIFVELIYFGLNLYNSLNISYKYGDNFSWDKQNLTIQLIFSSNFSFVSIFFSLTMKYVYIYNRMWSFSFVAICFTISNNISLFMFIIILLGEAFPSE